MNKREIKRAWDQLNPSEETSARILKKIEASAEQEFARVKRDSKTVNESKHRSFIPKRALVAAVACIALLILAVPLYKNLNSEIDKFEHLDNDTPSEVELGTPAIDNSAQGDDSSWQVDPQLQPYKLDYKELPIGDGMGFEGYIFKNREELLGSDKTGNPASKLRPDHLPIFRNLYYTVPPVFTSTRKELFADLMTEVRAYSDKAESVYFPEQDILGPAYLVDEEGEILGLPDGESEAKRILIEGSKYNYYMGAKPKMVTVLFKKPLVLPEGLVYNPYPVYEEEVQITADEANKDHEEKKQQVLKAFDYLYKNYSDIFNYQKTDFWYSLEAYSYNKNKGGFHLGGHFSPLVQECSGSDLTSEFIARMLQSGGFIDSVPYGAESYYEKLGFLPEDGWHGRNIIYGISKEFFREGINIEKQGDYPLRTEADAKDALLRGEYRTSYPLDLEINEDMIVKVDLVYVVGGFFTKDFIPYYKFFIETPVEQQQGFKSYGAYYVPAIHPDYLEPMYEKVNPIFNG